MSVDTLAGPDAPPRWTRKSGPIVRRSRRRRRLLQFTLLLLVALAVAGAVWAVWFSSALTVRGIRVVGPSGTAEQAIRATAAVPIGVPMMRVDTGDITRRIAGLPWVAAVAVDRSFPDEIMVTVVPRVPVAIQSPTGFGIDAQGRAFAPVEPLPSSLMRIDATGAALDAATATLLALPKELRDGVASMSAATPDDIVLHLTSGPIVRWGGPGRVEVKARVLTWLMREPAAVYNVSAPELPVTVGG